MKHILENIKKNEFEHAYLIYGEEDYLKTVSYTHLTLPTTPYV